MTDCRRSVSRSELIATIDMAAAVIGSERSRARLRRVAETTDAVAVGWFHCAGVGCPARQASYHHMGFQGEFDRLMAERFGVSPYAGAAGVWYCEPFIVGVEDA